MLTCEMKQREHLTAHSVDLDGVLYWRSPIQGQALLGLAHYGAEKLFAPPMLPKSLNRDVHPDGKWGMRDASRYLSHIVRGLAPGAIRFIERLNEDSDVIINTGRPAQKHMVDLTESKLKRAKIFPFLRGIYFKPVDKQINSMVSKGVALKELSEQYKEVTHTDDDISTVIPLARIFNDITFNVIEDWTTGLLVNELHLLKQEVPNNVHVYRSLKDIPI